MTWHLIDKELEKKLIELDPEIVKRLTAEVEKKIKSMPGRFDSETVVDVLLYVNGECVGSLYFRADKLEEIPEYNPNDWNEYPKITPPENKLMMFDGEDIEHRRYIGSAVFWNSIWLIPHTSPMLSAEKTFLGCPLQCGYLRTGKFKPWED